MKMRRTGIKKKQSVLVKLMLSPMRILKRARQLYMKGVQACAGELGYAGVASYSIFPVSQYHPDRSFLDDIKALRARFGGGDTIAERQILRKVHITDMKNDDDDDDNQTRLLVQMQLKLPSGKQHGMIRNMGRIDEDKPCNFQEDQIDMKKTTRTVLYSRKSYFH